MTLVSFKLYDALRFTGADHDTSLRAESALTTVIQRPVHRDDDRRAAVARVLTARVDRLERELFRSRLALPVLIGVSIGALSTLAN